VYVYAYRGICLNICLYDCVRFCAGSYKHPCIYVSFKFWPWAPRLQSVKSVCSVSKFGHGLRAFGQSRCIFSLKIWSWAPRLQSVKVYIQSQNLVVGSAPSVSQKCIFSLNVLCIRIYIMVLILCLVIVLMTYLFEVAGVCVADRRVNRRHC
jgi:hypothetical protein